MVKTLSLLACVAFLSSGGTPRVWGADPVKVVPKPVSSACAGDDFPISITQIKKELGTPTDSDDDFVDYRDKLNLRVSLLGHLEVLAMTNRAGTDLATKFFTSKLFKDEEGKAILELVKAKGGEKKVGRFEITAKESTVVNGMVILKITPLPKK
ncbi:hypothetical protein J8F10_21495 [Gemmata sp. G18]|uniref:Uncharacterized protein n=1 Tax=Gemmata palustris TaxID=2822762 RepID=A0ABS5BVW4_9BACT|nr:hypothetical protein [Gemmata palustris]MBP3957836.1 hypothetical protein [Gemmata palustris]